jgi:hypothetical protein
MKVDNSRQVRDGAISAELHLIRAERSQMRAKQSVNAVVLLEESEFFQEAEFNRAEWPNLLGIVLPLSC